RISLTERSASLVRYRDLIKTRADELANHISFEVGKPLWESRQEVAATVACLDHFLKAITSAADHHEIENALPGCRGMVRFFARGLMALIYPAGHPFFTPHLHFVPALLYGNPVVMKSTSHAPVTAQCIAELTHESGLPAGVFNMIHGDAEAGRRLVAH